jgi:hypothetical protein
VLRWQVFIFCILMTTKWQQSKWKQRRSNITYCTGLPETSERYCIGLSKTSERYVIFFFLRVIDSTISTFLLCTLNYQMLILTLTEVSQESLLAEISLVSLRANNMLWHWPLPIFILCHYCNGNGNVHILTIFIASNCCFDEY